MKINPRKIFWGKVNARVDGSVIPEDSPLDYDIGVADAEGQIQHLATIVGTLQEERYEAPLADFSFSPGTHTVALRATERATGLSSRWSTAVTFQFVDAEPNPPNAVAVE